MSLISLSSALMGGDLDMVSESKRLASFQGWPWKTGHLTAVNLAKAGFYYIPTKKGCDCVRCFCCYKELENWDEGDDPWVEHVKHQSLCLFAQLKTEESKLTLNQLAQLLAAREANRCHKFLTQLKAHKEVLEVLEEL